MRAALQVGPWDTPGDPGEWYRGIPGEWYRADRGTRYGADRGNYRQRRAVGTRHAAATARAEIRELWRIMERREYTAAVRAECYRWGRAAMHAERLGVAVPADAAPRYFLAGVLAGVGTGESVAGDVTRQTNAAAAILAGRTPARLALSAMWTGSRGGHRVPGVSA